MALAPVRIQDHFPVAPEKQLEEVVLYDGAVVTGGNLLTLVQSYIGFEYLKLYCGYTQNGSEKITQEAEVDVSYLLSTDDAYTQLMVRDEAGGAASAYLQLGASTDTLLYIAGISTGPYTSSGVYRVIGYKKRYATETKQVIIPVTPDWVSSGTFVNTDKVTVNQRYTIDASKLPSDFRNADGTIKNSVKCYAEIYNNSGVGIIDWFRPRTGEYYISSTNTLSSYGVEADKIGDVIHISTAGYGSTTTSSVVNQLSNSNVTNKTGASPITSAPCRLIVWNDEKTAISVPVGDKGYGGLVKTTLATAIADFTVPTVINFDAVAITTPLKVVQDATSDTLTLNQIGIWETTGNVKLGFDSAVTDREVVLEVYNETLSQVAFELSATVPQGQSSADIPVNIGSLEVLNNGDGYSLRTYSSDVFSNVVVNKCRWDVKLYSPL